MNHKPMEMESTLTVKKLKTIVSLKLNLFSKFHLSKQTFYQTRLSTKPLQPLAVLRTLRSSKPPRTCWSTWTTSTRRRSRRTPPNSIIQEPVCKVNNRSHTKKLRTMVKTGAIGILSKTSMPSKTSQTRSMIVLFIWMISISRYKMRMMWRMRI